VEFPEERDAVRQIVVEPIAKLVGQKQQDRDRGPKNIGRQRCRLPRPENRRQRLRDGMTHHFIRQQRSAEDEAEQKNVEIEVAEVGQTRLALENVARKKRAQQCAHADAPAFAQAAERQEGERDQKGGCKRGQRGVRAGSEEGFASWPTKYETPGESSKRALHTLREG
jgi:hypothetical protein